jgi:hypothetical protein
MAWELIPAVPSSIEDYDEPVSETVVEDAIAEEDDVQTEIGEFDGSIADS